MLFIIFLKWFAILIGETDGIYWSYFITCGEK